MDILTIKEYLIIESKDKSEIAISIAEVEDFDFSQCVCELKDRCLSFTPGMYSSKIGIEVLLVSNEHRAQIDKNNHVTVAQIKPDSSFGKIYQIPIIK